MSNDVAPSRETYSADYPYRPQPAVIVVNDRVEGFHPSALQFVIESQRGLIAGICLFLFFAGVNFLICPLMAAMNGPPSDWTYVPLFALFGAFLSESALLSAWLVFSGGSFWFRAASCFTAASVWWVCWAGGMMLAYWLASWGDLGQDLRLGSFVLPLVALAIQSPLWLVRIYSRWRLVNLKTTSSPISPLSIRDYFIGTAIVGISITIARFARPFHTSPNDFWLGMSIAFIFFACGAFFSVVPAMLLMFRFRDWRIGFGLLMLYGLIVSLVIVGILDATTPGRPRAFECAALITLFASLAAFVGAGMLIARDCGYSLLIGRENIINRQ